MAILKTFCEKQKSNDKNNLKYTLQKYLVSEWKRVEVLRSSDRISAGNGYITFVFMKFDIWLSLLSIKRYWMELGVWNATIDVKK